MGFYKTTPNRSRFVIMFISVVGVLFVGFILMIILTTRFHYRSSELPLTTLNGGQNKLELRLFVDRTMFSADIAHRLYWNGKLVADRTSDHLVNKDFGVPIDPDDQGGLVVLPVPADTLTDDRGREAPTWSVWVDPDTFSRADFDAMVACLTAHPDQISQRLRQPIAFDADENRSVVDIANEYRFVTIARLIYGKQTQLIVRSYTWKSPIRGDLALLVEPDGGVRLRYGNNRLNDAGQVRMEANQRVLYWCYPQDAFLLGRDLPNFAGDAGPLTNRYTLRHDPADKGNIFFRQESNTFSKLYIPPVDTSTVPPLQVYGNYVNSNPDSNDGSYDVGKIDSLANAKPVFRWRSWREADLRQFCDEQGRSINLFYVLEFQPSYEGEVP